jgi:hypothetical protein
LVAQLKTNKLPEFFHGGLLKLEMYLTSLQQQPPKFSPRELLRILDTFTPFLFQHLKDEIDSLLALWSLEPQIYALKIWKKEGNGMSRSVKRRDQQINCFYAQP